MRWAYGITTVRSRLDNLLPQTIDSLARAGFDEPAIFIDQLDGSQLDNWRRALRSIYDDQPFAERYAIFEDDLVTCANLRTYLDRCQFPEKGYWNLLTHDGVLTDDRGGWQPSTQRGRGAVGLVFDRPTVELLLGCEAFCKVRAESLKTGADGVVIRTLKPLKYREYVHNPSLLQHVGDTSTLGHKYGRMKTFLGEDYNPLELLAC